MCVLTTFYLRRTKRTDGDAGAAAVSQSALPFNKVCVRVRVRERERER